ncbi:MAG TPA: hypothetical protein VIX13_00970, partial [Candidatus Eisenbacteria bacterium]
MASLVLQVKREPPFAALAESWSRSEPPAGALLASTREALGAVRPDELAEVAPLVETLLAGLAHAGRRAEARRAL